MSVIFLCRVTDMIDKEKRHTGTGITKYHIVVSLVSLLGGSCSRVNVATLCSFISSSVLRA